MYREGSGAGFQEMNVATRAAAIGEAIEIRFQEFFTDPDHLNPVHLSDENFDEFIYLLEQSLEMLKTHGDERIAAMKELPVTTIREVSSSLVGMVEDMLREGALLPASNIEAKLESIKRLTEAMYKAQN